MTVTHVLHMLLGWDQGPVSVRSPIVPMLWPLLSRGTHTVVCPVLQECLLANGISCLEGTRNNLGNPSRPSAQAACDSYPSLSVLICQMEQCPCSMGNAVGLRVSQCGTNYGVLPHSGVFLGTPHLVLTAVLRSVVLSAARVLCLYFSVVPRFHLCRGLTTLASGSPQGLRVAK